MSAGETLIVTDPQGEQVADLFAYNGDDLAESLSSGRSIDYAATVYLTSGHVLYSNRSRPMFTIGGDTVGRHDFLLTPCSLQTFQIIYGHTGPHPGCFENLANAFAPFGIDPSTIGTTFNIFMNAPIAENGSVTVLPPKSVAGDFIEFRAEMNVLVGLTACSAELSNNYSFKPIDWALRARLEPDDA